MPDVIRLIVKPTFQQLQVRARAAHKKMIEQKRESVRILGRRWVQLARDEAPRRTGAFARSIIYRSFEKGENVGLSGYSAQPLGTWIVQGTKPHPIAAVNVGALYFFWPKVGMYTVVPKSDGFRTHIAGGKLLIGKGHVDHPGTKPNPYNERAWLRMRPDAIAELRKISKQYIVVLQGKE